MAIEAQYHFYITEHGEDEMREGRIFYGYTKRKAEEVRQEGVSPDIHISVPESWVINREEPGVYLLKRIRNEDHLERIRRQILKDEEK